MFRNPKQCQLNGENEFELPYVLRKATKARLFFYKTFKARGIELKTAKTIGTESSKMETLQKDL